MEPFEIRQTVDLARENAPKRYGQPLMKGDRNAHRWRVEILKDGKPADLTGVGGTLWLTNSADGSGGISAVGKAEIGEGYAQAVFGAACYAIAGEAVAIMELTQGEMTVGAAVLTLRVMDGKSGVVIDEDDLIPDIGALLSEITAMRAAGKEAGAAAQAAREAAQLAQEASEKIIEKAPQINESGNWMTWNAEENAYEDTGVPATGPEGATPYVGENGNWFVAGEDTGMPARGPQGPNGSGAGTVTGIAVNGETYEPDDTGMIDLGELGGGSGSVTGVAVNGETHTPDDTGVVDLGSLGTVAGVKVGGETKQPDNTGVVDLGELGGTGINVLDVYPVGSIYMSVNSTDPSELFGGWWEQLEDRFLLGAGANYAAGTTGGEAKHKLTVAELASHFHKTYVYSPSGSGKTSCPSQSAQAYVERSTTAAGGDQPHNNMPPYLVVYMWKRIEDQEVA